MHSVWPSVSLGVVGGGVVQLYPKELTLGCPELGSECGAPIRNDVGGYSVLGEDMSDVELGQVYRDCCSPGWDEQGHLAQAIDDNKDGIVLHFGV